MKKRVLILASLLTLVLVGCNTSKETNTPVENSVASVPVETATPEPTVTPTPTPTANQGTISGYEVTDQENETKQESVNSTSDVYVREEGEYAGDDPNDSANKPEVNPNKTATDEAFEVDNPNADSGLTVGPDGYAVDGVGADIDGDGVITNAEAAFWQGIINRRPSSSTSDNTTTPSGGSTVPGPTGQQGGLEVRPDQTDESQFGTHWGQGDYTGLEGGTVY